MSGPVMVERTTDAASTSGSPPRLGDTQLLHSQDLAHRLGYWRRSQEWTGNGTSNLSPNGHQTTDTGPRTYQTDDTGYVDLMPNLPTPESKTQPGIGEVQDSGDELDEISQLRPTLMTSPVFLSPTTPALFGRKRDHYGHVIDSVVRTPAVDLAAAFTIGGPRQGYVGLSQVFKQTQADSSPFLAMTKSDPIFERPSPDVHLPQPTSPPPALSSPIRLSRSPLRRSVSESRHAYESIKESQERRRQQASTFTILSSDTDDEDELDDDSEQRRMVRRRSRELFNRKAMKQFASVGAPATGKKGAGRKRLDQADLEDGKEGVIVISDDVHEDDAVGTPNYSAEDSVDEYDELSQAVIPSDRNAQEGELNEAQDELEDPKDTGFAAVSGEQLIVKEPGNALSKTRSRIGARRTVSSPARQTQNDKDEEQLRRSFPITYKAQSSGDSFHAFHFTNSLASQSLAVADSQPTEAMHIYDLVPPPRPVMQSSITSRGFLSESQAFSLSSATRAELAATPVDQCVESVSVTGGAAAHPGLSWSLSTQNAELLDSSPPQVASSARQLDVRLPTARHTPCNDENTEPSDTEKSASAMETAPEALPSRMTGAQADITTIFPGVLSQTIPETSPVPTPVSQSNHHDVILGGRTTTIAANQNQILIETNHNVTVGASDDVAESADVFATAEAYPLASTKTSSTNPQSSHDSPPTKRRRIRKLTEITEGLQSPHSPQDQLADITIMDEDELHFHNTIARSSPISSPVRRSRRIFSKRTTKPDEPVNMETLGSRLPRVGKLFDAPQQPIFDAVPSMMHASPPVIVLKSPDRPSLVSVHQDRVTTPRSSPHRKSKSTLSRRSVPSTADGTASPPGDDVPAASEDELTTDVVAELHTVSRQVPPAPAQLVHDRGLRTSTENVGAIVQPMVTPNRVLAKFRGKYMAYYPATCIELVNSSYSSVRVRFDDGTIDEVDLRYVIRFELRVGDVVKVDLPGLKSHTWTVEGFKECLLPADVDALQYPKSDIYGHTTVSLRSKKRQSLAAYEGDSDHETTDVPMGAIYMPLSMGSAFKDRVVLAENINDPKPRLHTPNLNISLPTTPSSRSRRQTFNPVSFGALVELPQRLIGLKSGIFANMAFAISYSTDDEVERNNVRRLLIENGAQLLDEGFDELFEVPVPSIVSPSKSLRPSEQAGSAKLVLTAGATTLGFTALIADTYSRRAKYMQALALNLPCMSGRWVIDSCQQGRALPWDRYLLPAGESLFLGGAVRSRTFPAIQTLHEPAGMRFRDTIDHRTKMLDGKNVLLVMGEGKADEKRKAYLFLTLTLGAAKVQRVRGIPAAKALLEQDRKLWDWVYVGDAKLADAKKELHGLIAGSVDASKKRKRDSRGMSEIDFDSSGGNSRKAVLVGDEYVMQSLILGALLHT